MEVDGTVNSDLSLNKMCQVSLIFDLQVLAWYFKKKLAYSDRFADMQLKPGNVGQSRGIFSKHLWILDSPLMLLKNWNVLTEICILFLKYNLFFEVDYYVFQRCGILKTFPE